MYSDFELFTSILKHKRCSVDCVFLNFGRKWNWSDNLCIVAKSGINNLLDGCVKNLILVCSYAYTKLDNCVFFPLLCFCYTYWCICLCCHSNLVYRVQYKAYREDSKSLFPLLYSLFPSCYLMIFVTTPAPTVLPPSRIAKCIVSSRATGVTSLTPSLTVSPGITISTPAGNVDSPVTSVVRI